MVESTLSDDQVWQILNTPSSVVDSELAAKLGVNQATIHNLRWKLRRHGWNCQVAYIPCQRCGELVTAKVARGFSRRYHPACYLEVRRERAVETDRRRWSELPDDRREVVLARAHEHTAKWQLETKSQAANRGRKWQEWEDDLAVDPKHLTDHQLALELGRSLIAVRTRRKVIKDRLKGEAV